MIIQIEVSEKWVHRLQRAGISEQAFLQAFVNDTFPGYMEETFETDDDLEPGTPIEDIHRRIGSILSNFPEISTRPASHFGRHRTQANGFGNHAAS